MSGRAVSSACRWLRDRDQPWPVGEHGLRLGLTGRLLTRQVAAAASGGGVPNLSPAKPAAGPAPHTLLPSLNLPRPVRGARAAPRPLALARRQARVRGPGAPPRAGRSCCGGGRAKSRADPGRGVPAPAPHLPGTGTLHPRFCQNRGRSPVPVGTRFAGDGDAPPSPIPIGGSAPCADHRACRVYPIHQIKRSGVDIARSSLAASFSLKPAPGPAAHGPRAFCGLQRRSLDRLSSSIRLPGLSPVACILYSPLFTSAGTSHAVFERL
jgi:hypothetical protein